MKAGSTTPSETQRPTARDKDIHVYRTELHVTSRILSDLNDTAFRNIALGQNYFRLLGLDYTAPPVCASQ